MDKSEGKFWTTWNKETYQFFLQFSFKLDLKVKSSLPPPPGVGNLSLPPPTRPPAPPPSMAHQITQGMMGAPSGMMHTNPGYYPSHPME